MSKQIFKHYLLLCIAWLGVCLAVAQEDRTPERLGNMINSTAKEFMPVISADGRSLYVIRKSFWREEAWVARLDEDGTWGELRMIGAPINHSTHNGVMSALPDNNTLLLFGQYTADGAHQGDGASLTRLTKTGWSMPENLDITDFSHTGGWLRFFLCPDGRSLLMCLQRPDAIGAHDIYVSFLQTDGRWSAPRNLGPDVNTPLIERVPFMSADMTTIYFSSEGHGSYGQGDIFMSRRLDSTWRHWSKPVNMGPLINSRADEDAIFITASGDYAYFSSKTPDFESDIFRVRLPDSLRPQPVLLLGGTVRDATGQPTATRITYHDKATGEELGYIHSNPADGSYQLALPGGREYVLRSEQPVEGLAAQPVDLRQLESYEAVHLDEMPSGDLGTRRGNAGVQVLPTEVFEAPRFASARSEVDPGDYEVLNRLAQVLAAAPHWRVELAGHTDDEGTTRDNERLSLARAEQVRWYLIGQGVAPARILVRGYGETRPQVPNDSDDARAINRRVEICLLP